MAWVRLVKSGQNGLPSENGSPSLAKLVHSAFTTRGQLLLLSREGLRERGRGLTKQVLDLGRVGRAVGEADRRQEELRCVLVVEFVGEGRHELRDGLIDGQRRTGEGGVGADGA